ncbi:hypothetical protein QN277_023053 [Acacia crassicarpa]|uniref:Transmembrane protein n=1 Tax=Acacia crassicarpa TaxID=499986 RepID=A0AAE1MJD5_9FABA|nr:hypothetical protein QN277_023053 [Acacia crassicarpa]
MTHPTQTLHATHASSSSVPPLCFVICASISILSPSLVQTHGQLRLLLIFLFGLCLSHGFFILRNLKSQPHLDDHDNYDEASSSVKPSDSSIPAFSKIWVAIEYGFCTFVNFVAILSFQVWIWFHFIVLILVTGRVHIIENS